MGYSIHYDPEQDYKYPQKSAENGAGRWLKLSIFICGLLICCLVAANREQVRNWLLPGDPVVTSAALEDLTINLRDGVSAGDAITAFCREILDSAAK